jgi:hypothetical protein
MIQQTLEILYCTPKKEGGQEGYQSILFDFVHNRRCFLDTLKGLIFCFKFQKTIAAFTAKKVHGDHFCVFCVSFLKRTAHKKGLHVLLAQNAAIRFL